VELLPIVVGSRAEHRRMQLESLGARTGETQRHRGHGEKGRDVVRGQGGEMRAGDEVQRAERGADYKEFKL